MPQNLLRPDDQRRARQLAVVVRELVSTTRFESLADLTDALKYRCRQLRLPVTPDAITEAYRLVAERRCLVAGADRDGVA